MAIITSLLDADFYKFTMGQFVFRHFRNVRVGYAFRCRTKNVRLGKVINLERLRYELNEARKLRFTNTELHYLRGTNEYGERMFGEDWLEFLKGLQLPEFRLELDETTGGIILEFYGLWPEMILWETIALSIVTELYGECLMERLSSFERDVVHATGRVRFAEKIRFLRGHPEVKFSDFGSRRRFSGAWQQYIVETLRDELPKQFLGTSNAYLAMKAGIVPMGTSAHELQMVAAGLMDGSGDGWLAASQRQITDLWWKEFGWGLSIFLPDTFGTDFFLSNLTEDDLVKWKGFRWDSGDPYHFGDKILAIYGKCGIDSKSKLLIPSDGLVAPVMVELAQNFLPFIKVSAGWGTNLTNDLFDNKWHGDLWYGPLSLVVKPVEANGRGLVKLSDNLAKAIGKPENIERYKREAGYTNTDRVECVY